MPIFKFIGIFLNQDAVILLGVALFLEHDYDWQAGKHLFSLTSMKHFLFPDDIEKVAPINFESLMNLEVLVE